MSFAVLVGISVGMGSLAVGVALRIWLVRTGRFQRINQNITVPALAVSVGIMTIGSMIGLIWGRDKGAAELSGITAALAAVATVELYRRQKSQRTERASTMNSARVVLCTQRLCGGGTVG